MITLFLALTSNLSAPHIFAGEDARASKDHALIPRIADSCIPGYEYSEYGELRLPL